MRHDTKLTITLASGLYDITRPLIAGLVDVEGIKLNVLAGFRSVDEIFRRMLNYEFDASEMSVSHYLIARERGLPFSAIPVFLNRVFPHSNFFRGRFSRAERLQDLEGKRVGLPAYQVTRAVWWRGILEEEYGLQRTAVTWVTSTSERMDLHSAPGVKVEKTPNGRTIEELLADGYLEAAICWLKPTIKDVEYFFSDSKNEEINYYRKTGIFPIMHTVVVKTQLVEQYPWLARCLVEAYAKSKQIWYEWRDKISGGSMPIAKYGLQEQESIMGRDPFPFDLQSNVKVLEAVRRYAVADGFIKKETSAISTLW
jgi:4,5-dihydroxyphthalate decarboxylase